MCLIVDNDVAQRVICVDDDPDFSELHKALFKDKTASVRIVYGGHLKTEYLRNQEITRRLVVLDRAGRTRKISDNEVNAETELVASLGLCESNDTHVIALARVAKVRLLCSADKTLYKDFHNKELIDNPRGKVYLNPTHRHLIAQFCK